MADVTLTQSLPWWRRPISPRLTVGRLMLLVLVVGGGLGWTINAVHVQRRAVLAIQGGGGVVGYNIHTNSTFLFRPEPGASREPQSLWFRDVVDWFGPDYFGHVNAAKLGPRNTDAESGA
jgi:hypothetical protein